MRRLALAMVGTSQALDHGRTSLSSERRKPPSSLRGPDVNGDGYVDLVVSHGESPGFVVYYGPLPQTPSWSPVLYPLEHAIPAMANLGDLDADGTTDLAFGHSRAGQLDIYRSPEFAKPAWSFPESAERNYGEGIASLGRARGGLWRLVAGGRNAATDVFVRDSGPALVRHSSTLQGPPDTQPEDFGRRLRSAGDLNADGKADLLVDDFKQGRVHVYVSNRKGRLRYQRTVFQGDAPGGDRFGEDMVGEFRTRRKKRRRSFLVTWPNQHHEADEATGAAWLFTTPRGDEPTGLIWGLEAESYFGWTAASLGDFNSDGWDDLAFSAAPRPPADAQAILQVHIYSGKGLWKALSDGDDSTPAPWLSLTFPGVIRDWKSPNGGPYLRLTALGGRERRRADRPGNRLSRLLP